MMGMEWPPRELVEKAGGFVYVLLFFANDALQ